MLNNNPYQQYRQNSIKSASKGELTLMLYEGSAKYIRQAIKHIGESDIQAAHNSIVRAQEIIDHLNETLDPDYELSAGLALLYDYIKRRLMEANIKKDVDILSEALDFVRQLRDTWKEALNLSRSSHNQRAVI